MIIKNCKTYPENRIIDINIEDGKVSNSNKDDNAIDAGNCMVIPSFSELHIHLDSVFILNDDIINNSGTLEEGIALWDRYRNNSLNSNELHNRVIKAINLLLSNGITRIRTNIDVSDPNLIALKEMVKLKHEIKDVDLQVTAFPQHGMYTDENNLELLEKSIELGADNVGLAPHLEDTREDGIKSVLTAYDLAEKYDRNIDGHIDETDDPQSRFIETLAKEKIKRDFKGSVSAGHLTAMHSYNNQYASKAIKLIGRAGINVISNPLINMHLQGRYDSYPRIRGVTRIKELLDNHVNVALGQDCIMDPWYPIGSGDPLDALFMAIHAEPLMAPQYLNNSLNMLTYNAATAFGAKNYGYAIGSEGDFIITDAKNAIEVFQYRHSRTVVRHGKIIGGKKNE
ncbi:MAG: amidohydrolase family protein [Ferroplasma sp.]